MTDSSNPNKANQQNSDSESKPKNTDQKSKKFDLSKLHGLFNVWTGIGAFLAIVAGTLIHGFLANILLIGGAIFFLIAVHVELHEKFGNRLRYLSPTIGIVIVLVYILQPKNENNVAKESIQSYQTVDSAKNARADIDLERKIREDSLRKIRDEKYLEFKSRPRLVLYAINLFKESQKPTLVLIKIDNLGESAAIKIKMNYELSLYKTPTNSEFMFELEAQRVADISPKERRDAAIPLVDSLANKLLEKLKSHELYLYAFGRIVYFSELHVDKKYIHDFCLMYDPLTDIFQEVYPYNLSYAKKGETTNKAKH